MSQQTILKHCPFCKGVVEMYEGVIANVPMFICANCKATISFGGKETIAESIAAWNRRPTPKTNFEKWKEGVTVDDLVNSILSCERGEDRCRMCLVGFNECMSLARCGGAPKEECVRIIKHWADVEVDYGNDG